MVRAALLVVVASCSVRCGCTKDVRELERRLAPFAVIATQRTGSQWVMKTLSKEFCDVDATPEIFTGGDGWNTTAQRAALETLFFDVTVAAPAAAAAGSPRQFRRDVERAQRYRRPTAYGFKWMLNQGLDELFDWFLNLCVERGAKIVFLKRRDYLRMYVSYRAMKAGAHPETAEAAAAVPRVTLPSAETLVSRLADYEARFEKMDEYAARAAAAGVATTTHVYEDLAADPSGFLDIRDFLTAGLPPALCNASFMDNYTVQIHKKHPSEYVRNWPEVVSALENTSYREFLA